VIAIVLLIILLTQGSGSSYVPPETTSEPEPVERPHLPKDDVTVPLTEEELARIRSTIENLAPGERKARRLKDEGFEAQREQDYDRAQAKWREARDVLFSMIEEVELIAIDMGEERVERYAQQWYKSVGAWQRLLSDIIKQLK
jgi:hypothetical protein